MGSLCCGFQQPNIIKPNEQVCKFTILTEITKYYKIGKVLGAGHFGTVRLAKYRANSNQIFAVKIISKQKVSHKLHTLRREIDILWQLDHPNIVRLYEVYEDAQFIHLVMEYCSGGELIEKLLNNQHYSEQDAATIFKQILLAVNHLHQVGISHRDIKPENFIFENKEPNSLLKLIDFGLSSKFSEKLENKQMYTMVGTPYYVAPEVLQGEYNYKCDAWSCGVILYVLLSGNLPFYGENNTRIFNKILNTEVKFIGDVWNNVGFEARHLIQRLLDKNPRKRIDLQSALNHSWFESATTSKQISIQSDIFERLANYNQTSVFKKQVLGYIVKTMSSDQIKELRDAFIKYDKTQTGYLSISDLKFIISECGFQMSNQKLNDIIQNVDWHNNGRIDYSEFLAATIQCKQMLKKEQIQMAFQHFDVDGTGTISRDDLIQLYNRGEVVVSKSQLDSILDQVDLKGKGEVTFEEFEAMLLET